ncbi:MAG TPA: YceI family protein [Kofleriaceae bacterium]|jgi:polyisoprenoid-binding protein YceI|nr:YceI family protein [Kofleriaceae bacterium]
MSKTTWNFDTSHAEIGFTVRHMMISKVRGRFARWNGEIQLDEQDLGASQLTVRIDAASIDTNEDKRDAHLRSADFFDVDNHPQLVFTSKQVTDLGEGALRLTGDLTIRGVTREVDLDVQLEGKSKDPWGNERIGFSAQASINRKDFGLHWNALLETGGVVVGDKIQIGIEVELVRAAAAAAA